MKKLSALTKLLFPFVLLMLIGCSDQSIVKRLDKEELRSIMMERSDFSDFLESHVHNKFVLAELSNDDKEYLNDLESRKEVEVKSFFGRIEFDVRALDHFGDLTSYLKKNYTYKQEDFVDICVESLQHQIDDPKGHHSSRTSRIKECWIAASGCDVYCSEEAIARYGPSSENPSETNKAVYYSGCMNGCNNPKQ